MSCSITQHFEVCFLYDGHRVSVTGEVKIERKYLTALYNKYSVNNSKFIRTHAVLLGQKQVPCPIFPSISRHIYLCIHISGIGTDDRRFSSL
jgi:hypothetical protein